MPIELAAIIPSNAGVPRARHLFLTLSSSGGVPGPHAGRQDWDQGVRLLIGSFVPRAPTAITDGADFQRYPIDLSLHDAGDCPVPLRAAPDLALRPKRQRAQFLDLGVVRAGGIGKGKVARIEDLRLAAQTLQDAGGFQDQQSAERALAQPALLRSPAVGNSPPPRCAAISLLLDEAGFFEWAALHVARWGGGRGRLLFAAIVLLSAAVSSLFANDGAALILTPIVIAMLLALGFREKATLAFVMAAGFIADTASLPLVVSNLVNIVSADFFKIGFGRYALVMIPVDIATIAAALPVRPDT